MGLVGFGLDSPIEIGAPTVVIWELRRVDDAGTDRALRLLGPAFTTLAVYLMIPSVFAVVMAHRPSPSPSGIRWTSMTAVAMYSFALGKFRVGNKLGNPVLLKESRVTVIDGTLALAVLAGLLLTTSFDSWLTDCSIGLVLAVHAAREARELLHAA